MADAQSFAAGHPVVDTVRLRMRADNVSGHGIGSLAFDLWSTARVTALWSDAKIVPTSADGWGHSAERRLDTQRRIKTALA